MDINNIKTQLLKLLRPVRNRFIYYASRKVVDFKSADSHKVVVTLAADYGNLGDKAITNAQINYLQNVFPQSEVIVINVSETYKYLRSLHKILSDDDLITILGGGNMGTTYSLIEAQRQFIIKKFLKYRIVAFPQSIYYDDTKKGRASLRSSVRVYSRHPNLVLFSRDKKSFEIMKKNFVKNEIKLAPDIVLSESLDLLPVKVVREDNLVVLSLRSDTESSIANHDSEELKVKLLENKYRLIERDTEVSIPKMSREQGRAYLVEHLALYGRASVVITDRLHGVIFCVITRTPCIAINNSNGKVHALYNTWLKSVEYIRIVQDLGAQSILNEIKALNKIKNHDSMLSLVKHFDILEESLKG